MDRLGIVVNYRGLPQPPTQKKQQMIFLQGVYKNADFNWVRCCTEEKKVTFLQTARFQIPVGGTRRRNQVSEWMKGALVRLPLIHPGTESERYCT